eukprot:CAMPEP_0172483452 /NCGR_PEP_ID=MMETSP1066-20121228/10478_1 /TAXON_ID=671091 /ORGANISM="Coscinodiscus wailesii, Strain CCMP2513" /LENGTH=1157 /DNA_ID=CAMNT_0013247349 /DNA_START=273 /DNA_END=3746 /DNA_ORIENTATION=-
MSNLPPALDFAKTEEEICAKWKKEDTFHTQNRLSKERGDKDYTFYDGPPFATGLPHYGHILAGTIKDVVTRYACQTGNHVERRAGWDCHGLPVEYEIDQKLNITHRDQVLAMGIDKYNDTCKGIVTRYTKEWEATIERLGRWIDFENDYKTMDLGFMESVWWVFSRLFEKGLVYQGYKVMPFSTACGTPLSNFEAGLNYKDVKDPSVVVSFSVVGEDYKALAWTTTPWTLVSNLALCVHPTMEYVKIEDVKSKEKYVLAKSRLSQLYPQMNSKKWKPAKAKEIYTVLESFEGKALVGKKYEPLFNFFSSDNYFSILSDTYVTDDSGTGIVHQAPAFGEDDYRVCLSHGVIQKGGDIPCPVDGNSLFMDEIEPVKGLHIKKVDPVLIELIKGKGRLVQKDVLLHSYPYCWRSDTPLIYKAVPSWFVKVEEIRDRIVENNNKTYWVPSTVKEGRFHNWLVDARDWAVSRNRFWGTPIPIWASEDMSEVVCVGSIEQLKELSGKEEITDLHRQFVDNITIPSKKNPGTVLKRIDEVFDCWFESGSMPYAQKHYPFENKEQFEKTFPADFIAEGLDQTRGWFYTLMVLSTALFDKPAFQNLICNGLVLAGDGKKMSKRLKNYPDPNLIISKYGADALRMYLVNSPVVRAESLKFQEPGVLGVVKEVFLPWYNAFRFFCQNVQRWESITGSQFSPNIQIVKETTNPTDVWISAATQKLIQFVHEEMNAYRLYTVMPALVEYIDQLTNWYVRLNRDRLKGTEGDDAQVGLQVLYDVLLSVSILMAPFTPFFSEYLYQHLRKWQSSYSPDDHDVGNTNPVAPGKSNSVHYLPLPAYDTTRLNDDAVEAMNALQTIVECGRVIRERRNISLRTPVKEVYVVLDSPTENVVKGISGPLKHYILSELNAWDFIVVPKEEEDQWVKMSLAPNFTILGRKLGKKMKDVKKTIEALSHVEALAALEAGKLNIHDVEIDTKTEVISKLSFAKTDPEYEATNTPDGATVVAVNCTQDEAILSAGKCREFVNIVQQLRKSAGLDLTDIVEVFYSHHMELEKAIRGNVQLMTGRLKGILPLSMEFKTEGSVVLGTGEGEIGGKSLQVVICRRMLSTRDGLEEGVVSYLRTVDAVAVASKLNCVIDGKKYELNEGVDYWKSAADKAKSTKTLDWL